MYCKYFAQFWWHWKCKKNSLKSEKCLHTGQLYVIFLKLFAHIHNVLNGQISPRVSVYMFSFVGGAWKESLRTEFSNKEPTLTNILTKESIMPWWTLKGKVSKNYSATYQIIRAKFRNYVVVLCLALNEV